MHSYPTAKEPMSLETSAAGGALIKIFGAPVVAGAAAAALGFLFMWPKSMKEAAIRFVCAVLCALILGPALVIAVWSWWPNLFEAAKLAAVQYGVDPLFGLLYIAVPFLVLAALPAWWLLGGLVLWFERRKDKDIGEMAQDAASVVKDVRGAL